MEKYDTTCIKNDVCDKAVCDYKDCKNRVEATNFEETVDFDLPEHDKNYLEEVTEDRDKYKLLYENEKKLKEAAEELVKTSEKVIYSAKALADECFPYVEEYYRQKHGYNKDKDILQRLFVEWRQSIIDYNKIIGEK
jgi:predicted Holliday junction resolvase-like endonuclease